MCNAYAKRFVRAIQPLFLLVIARLVRAIQSYDLMR